MSTTEITRAQPQDAITPASPMQMIQKALDAALSTGNGLAVANLILDQMKEQRDYEDRARFQNALRRIQDKLKPIVKDCENRETKSRYASAEAVDNAIDSLLALERMSLSFMPRESSKPEMVLIVGILSLDSYAQEYPLEMPADGKGAKGGGVMSRTHATGSAITYAKRYLKNMIFDLKFREKDDDGNRAGNSGGMNPDILKKWLDAMHSAPDPDELAKIWREAYGIAERLGDKAAMFDLITAHKREKAGFK